MQGWKFAALRGEEGRSYDPFVEGVIIVEVERKGGPMGRGGGVPLREGERVVEAERKKGLVLFAGG